MVKIGILGAAGYTGGELIRVLLGHPQVEIVFANSESNAGNPVSDVHEGLVGETNLCFTDKMPFDQVDVVFFCFGHGKSEQFLKEHEIPSNVKIIDLAQDFRIKREKVIVNSEQFAAAPDREKVKVNSEQFAAALDREKVTVNSEQFAAAPDREKVTVNSEQFAAAPDREKVTVNSGSNTTAVANYSLFTIPYNFVYGLPETHREQIRTAKHLANPGCFATCIQLAMLPALKAGIISGDIHVNGITGSTGAGQKPGATTHFSWRNDNISVYKTFTHQHLLEINQTVQELCPDYEGRVLFIPQRGCFTRGIFVTAYAKCDLPIEEVRQIYADYYRDAAFTHFVLTSPDMKQVVNTNKALVYVEKFEDQLLMISCIDNLLKGAVGQAVQNMNLMFGLDEKSGLQLKASAF